MPIKVSSIFKDASLESLEHTTKLFYIYLITNPQLSVLGICPLNLKSVCLQLNYTIETVREASASLVKKKLLKVIESEGTMYFILTQHYKTNPKGNATVKKAEAEMQILPEVVLKFVNDFIDISMLGGAFEEPTVEEIEAYAMSCGFLVDGQVIVDYYKGRTAFYRKKSGWYDGKGKQVIDWKRKVRNVWCRDENKLRETPDAPKGFEYFHVKSNGRIIYPDYWRNGKPHSKEGLISTTLLQEKYEQIKNS